MASTHLTSTGVEHTNVRVRVRTLSLVLTLTGSFLQMTEEHLRIVGLEHTSREWSTCSHV